MCDATMLLALLLLLCAHTGRVHGQSGACITMQTCAECIRTPACAWCASQNFSEKVQLSRCRSTKNQDALRTWCDENYIINPESGKTTSIEDKSFNDHTLEKYEKPIQIRPQRAKLSLRVGEYSNLTVRFKRARNRLVDVYFLLDMSASLESVKNSVAELTAEIQNLTSNLRLGFGSFLDKDIAPMNVSPELKYTKDGKKIHDIYSRGYSFKNHMSLSNDIVRAQEAFNSLKGLTLPECYKYVGGLLDGVMQSMVCRRDIKWQQNAYRLLVILTDKDFHIAGDGKFAGLIEPNDGNCHLNSDGEYTHSLLYDYPSISQVKKTTATNNINVILVATEGSAKQFAVLQDMIDEVSVVYSGKDNLTSSITQEIKKISGTVKLTDNRGDNVDVKYFTKCGNREEVESNTCSFSDYDEEVVFTARIKVASCPSDGDGGAGDWRQLMITPVGVDESVSVQLDVTCECDRCARDTSMSEANSPACSGQGDLECGACMCHDGFVGARCECAGSSTPEEHNPACRGLRDRACSGFGSCICSTCLCHKRPSPQERYYGRVCQCDFSCKRHEGKVCADHGHCDCGECKCNPGWTGEACQCADTLESCRRPGEMTVCGGRGHCQCGECICSETDDGHHYSGQYCEESPTEPGLKCKYFLKCAECEVGRVKTSEECRNCSFYGAILLDDIKDDGYDSDVDKICPLTVEDGCIFYYRYRFQNSLYHLWVQKELDCSPNILGIIFGVIGFTVLIGLLIILAWKILMHIHDKREFAKFEHERAKAKWDQHGNPLFKPSTTTFTNPTFKMD